MKIALTFIPNALGLILDVLAPIHPVSTYLPVMVVSHSCIIEQQIVMLMFQH